MNYPRLLLCIVIMAAVTYLVRMLPLAVCKKRIENRFVKSFLAYVPYGVLAAMAFPEVLYSTANLFSALVGFAAALVLAYFGRSLLTVALSSATAVFLTEQLLRVVG